MKTWSLRALAAGATFATVLALQTNLAHAQSAEAYFTNTGPWAVTYTKNPPGLDGWTLGYPTYLGAYGYKHPIVTLGLGTGEVIRQAEATIRHLASWGYAVIASNDNEVGDGELVLGGAYIMQMLGSIPTHAFANKLDPNKVAAVGLSQGAIGALNAAIGSQGVIKSIVLWGMPDTCNYLDTQMLTPGQELPLPTDQQLSQLNTPIFFIRGIDDELSTENGSGAVYIEGWCTAPRAPNRGTQYWFAKVSGPAAKASRRNITEKYAWPSPSFCDWEFGEGWGRRAVDDFLADFLLDIPDAFVQGLPMLHLEDHCYVPEPQWSGGYTTAWLKYTLEGNALARSAFAGASPQIATNANWANWQAKGLP